MAVSNRMFPKAGTSGCYNDESLLDQAASAPGVEISAQFSDFSTEGEGVGGVHIAERRDAHRIRARPQP